MISIALAPETRANLRDFNNTFAIVLSKSVDFTLLEFSQVDPLAPPPTSGRSTMTGTANNETQTYLGFPVGSMGAAIGILIAIIVVPLVVIGAIVGYFLTHKTDSTFDEYEQL